MSLLERSIPLLGESGIEKLNKSSVIVFGVGGVGSWCAEALARCGVGSITVVDGDIASETNRNRQLIALNSTLGKSKADLSAERIKDINPNCNVKALNLFYSAETKDEIDLTNYDFIADCIDTVTSKILLITTAKEKGVEIISSMGTGNRIDPSKIAVKDVYSTAGDPLARVMRKELKARDIKALKVVFSEEPPKECIEGRNEITGRATPSSIIFVPATAGIRMAFEIVSEIIKDCPAE
ncbi:MAG: tRNA threonylcarbamoyladenosine dehydratase [Ruminococcaceae bacterium]|nr:tRNA threonylcarbamoyladenosine dehydratase [Oscillospiraceae bacterium]